MKKNDLLMILKGILKGRGQHKKKRNFLYYALGIIFSLILVLALAIWMLMSGIFGSKKDKHAGTAETGAVGMNRADKADKKDVDKKKEPREKEKLKVKTTEKAETRKYIIEKTAHSLEIRDKTNDKRVFSYKEDNRPVYTWDRPDYGEEGIRTNFYISGYSVSDDEKYVTLQIGDYDDRGTFSSHVYEITTGKRIS